MNTMDLPKNDEWIRAVVHAWMDTWRSLDTITILTLNLPATNLTKRSNDLAPLARSIVSFSIVEL